MDKMLLTILSPFLTKNNSPETSVNVELANAIRNFIETKVLHYQRKVTVIIPL